MPAARAEVFHERVMPVRGCHSALSIDSPASHLLHFFRPGQVTRWTCPRASAWASSLRRSCVQRLAKGNGATAARPAEDWLHEIKYDGYRMHGRLWDGRLSY
jgi:hypothetical protein